MVHTFLRTAAAVVVATALAACGSGNDDDNNGPVAVGDTVALTASGRLASFDRATPGTTVGSVAVTGLAMGESLLGIDYRPADGLLYALSSTGRLYTVNPATGAATVKSTLTADAADTSDVFVRLTGESFGVDFNPAADRLRVVSNSGQSLRINVDTGATTTDGAVTRPGGTASVSATGYTNAFAGAATTQLFVIDAAAGQLYLQDPPNDGTLGAPRPLGVTATASNGFDIDARNNRGYAALTVAGTTRLYTVDLVTGTATAAGTIGNGEALRGIALRQPAAPTALGLTQDNRLLAFNPAAPSTASTTVTISGLVAGERIVGIDTRPNGGLLWGLSSNARLFTIDPASGAASFRATLVADPTDTSAPYTGLAGMVVAVDFNPAADRLRVITDQGQNLRINVDTGATTTDGVINKPGGMPLVAAVAYTNSFAGTTSTTLYDLDAGDDTLAVQTPPNDGTLAPVGPWARPSTSARPHSISPAAATGWRWRRCAPAPAGRAPCMRSRWPPGRPRPIGACRAARRRSGAPTGRH